MTTVGEIDRDGKVVRIFHRSGTAAWDHPPGRRGRYWGGRHGGERRIEMPCACDLSFPTLGDEESDGSARGDGPRRAPGVPEAAVGGAP